MAGPAVVAPTGLRVTQHTVQKGASTLISLAQSVLTITPSSDVLPSPLLSLPPYTILADDYGPVGWEIVDGTVGALPALRVTTRSSILLQTFAVVRSST